MKSIRTRLTTRILLATLVIFTISAVLLDAGIRRVLVRECDAALKTRALAIAALTRQENGRIDLELSGDMAAEFEGKGRASCFQLWRSDGSTVARSASLGTSDLPRETGALATPRFWNLTLPNGEDGRAVALRFVPAIEGTDASETGRPSGPLLTLVMAHSFDPVDDTLEALRIVLLIGCLGMLAALMLAIRQAVRRGLAPLAIVTERAAAIDASSLGQRFPAESLPSELAPICRCLNDLLARLEQSFERERRFTADAAHELRTPIAELRSLAEVSLKWPEDAASTRLAFQDRTRGKLPSTWRISSTACWHWPVANQAGRPSPALPWPSPIW